MLHRPMPITYLYEASGKIVSVRNNLIKRGVSKNVFYKVDDS